MKKVEVVTQHDAVGVEFIRSDFVRSRSATRGPAIHAHQIHVRDGDVAPLVGFRANIVGGSSGHAGAPVNAAAFEIGLIAIGKVRGHRFHADEAWSSKALKIQDGGVNPLRIVNDSAEKPVIVIARVHG